MSKVTTHEHTGHRSRLRDRVRKDGVESFQDYQILEYLLSFVIPYKDTNILAHNIINKFGTFAGVLEAEEEELMKVTGMGEVTAHFLSHLLQVFHYYQQDKAKNTIKITSPSEAYGYINLFLKNKLVEELYIVCLTANNKIICVEKITEGSSTEASIPIRLIGDKMSKVKCSNIIVAHNHPGGRAIPSNEDDTFTKALVASLSLTGCHLLDHLIIGEEGYYSYRGQGLIDEYKQYFMTMMSPCKIAQPCAKYEVGDYDKK